MSGWTLWRRTLLKSFEESLRTPEHHLRKSSIEPSRLCVSNQSSTRVAQRAPPRARRLTPSQCRRWLLPAATTARPENPRPTKTHSTLQLSRTPRSTRQLSIIEIYRRQQRPTSKPTSRTCCRTCWPILTLPISWPHFRHQVRIKAHSVDTSRFSRWLIHSSIRYCHSTVHSSNKDPPRWVSLLIN